MTHTLTEYADEIERCLREETKGAGDTVPINHATLHLLSIEAQAIAAICRKLDSAQVLTGGSK